MRNRWLLRMRPSHRVVSLRCSFSLDRCPLQGFMSSYEINDNIRDRGWVEAWDDERKVPYAYGGGEWCGHTNQRSLSYKSQLARDKNLGGIMFWGEFWGCRRGRGG